MKNLKLGIIALALSVMAFSACTSDAPAAELINETAAETQSPADSNIVKSNKTALTNNIEDLSNEPFSSYTYDFTVYDNNYMITVTPDKTNTGLTLTVEDKNFNYTTFTVTPPDNYIVCYPYSAQYASSVCSVIKNDIDSSVVPNLLKIDFYLNNFEDESLPYTVSRLYSILDGRLVEVEVYDNTEGLYEPIDYIPDNDIYHTEPLKFMAYPDITVNENGGLDAKIKTYNLNPNDMTMTMAYENISEDNMLYYGYMAYASATNIYRYFASASPTVSDYENFHVITEGDTEKYFFTVDDSRFSTVEEMKKYVGNYFSEAITDKMFRNAPQDYRDIDGRLCTLLGDGGMDDSLGKLTITSWEIDGNTVTFRTRQEKFNDEYTFAEYIDGGNFTVVIDKFNESADGIYPADGFTVTEYRYPLFE